MSRLVTKPSFRYFAHWKSDVRQRWQVFTILKTNAATIFFLATLPVVLRTVLGSAISANAAKGTLLRPPHPPPQNKEKGQATCGPASNYDSITCCFADLCRLFRGPICQPWRMGSDLGLHGFLRGLPGTDPRN